MDNMTSTKNVTEVENRPVVILVGTLRAVDLTYKNLIEKVIEPLNADLIFCVSQMSSEDEACIEKFRGCNIVDICIYEDGKNGYQNFLDKFFHQLTPEKQRQWHKYFDIEGNWLGGLKGRRGSGFHLNFNYWQLFKRLQNLKKGGSDYQRFIITRTDLFWLVEHPPLNLLEPKLLWIPTGENYNGYNDRHAICSDQNVADYLSLFEFMLSLKALVYIYNDLDGNNLNHERHLKSHLDYCGVEVARFKNVAYLTGDKQSTTNWASVKTKLIEGKEYAYKYEEELLSSLKHMKEFSFHKNWDMMLLEKTKENDSSKKL
ncbi:hypothetical protein [Aphanothece sacrum]|uniref:Uncharacterized protein n=1 Tax=Aphanothece sacrum FPU1 TaxID=1920663 RepID=A0A401IIS9_APHSA|nr:hypothetical protein [Aphanothece sacrum]GBF81187.1 hypothetical protein AsFPU1_2599 [Aphanothece sacrum FPU1]GBF83464.1 hypothetical protein AsFPU3_0506 [Aphanothece sacrum FPU3]